MMNDTAMAVIRKIGNAGRHGRQRRWHILGELIGVGIEHYNVSVKELAEASVRR